MRNIFVLSLLTTLAVINWRGVRGGVLPPEDPEDEPEWDNFTPIETFTVDCPCGYALYRVRSRYDDDYNLRQWDWDCKKISDVVKDECLWYSADTEAPESLLFRCPKGQYMAGIRTTRPPRLNFDFLWSFKCCKTIGICPVECELSCYINDYQEYIDYTAHEDYGVFVGLYNRYNVNETDTQWLIEECKAKPCQLIPGVDLYKRDDEEDEDEGEWEEGE